MNYFCFHKWTKWSDPFDSKSSDYKKAQTRRCVKCGKVHVSYIKAPWNFWFDASTLIEKLKGQP